MHKITFTQNSTGKQIDYMQDNLREKHKTHVSIQRLSTGFKSGRSGLKYWINVHGVAFAMKETWEEAQGFYKWLMRLRGEHGNT